MGASQAWYYIERPLWYIIAERILLRGRAKVYPIDPRMIVLQRSYLEAAKLMLPPAHNWIECWIRRRMEASLDKELEAIETIARLHVVSIGVLPAGEDLECPGPE